MEEVLLRCAVSTPEDKVELACIVACPEEVVLELGVTECGQSPTCVLLLGHDGLQAIPDEGGIPRRVDGDTQDLGAQASRIGYGRGPTQPWEVSLRELLLVGAVW